MSERPIGGVLDGLGIKAVLAPDTLVADAIVILKTVLSDGSVRLSVAHSTGLGRVDAAGMLHVAAATATADLTRGREPGA